MPPKPPSNPYDDLVQKYFDLKRFESPEPQDDEIIESEEYSEEDYRAALLNQQLELKIEQQKQYAGHIFVLIVSYLVAVFIIMILAGYEDNKFTLSNSVLITV